jgi:site-specific DNA recombinase
MTTNKSVRCAVYTRKSSEEGPEQSFNSLEAQRDACRAYILSQKHEGWIALSTKYDDGGFSGGTMERPALKQLLDDILNLKVDTVVVYKVDRLTRSLMDFSKIIEVFDSHGVSFVSVTQQFNTTTSMGRLTLNVLLSFAQFEREVTGERIRDKVAASKKKGMWMGGFVPQGYDWVERRLVVNPKEAKTVRRIFQEYMRLGSVSELRTFLECKHVHSKIRRSATERASGGKVYSRGALHHLLKNRIYIGEIVHRGKSYPGQHEAIVPQDLWNEVAARLEKNNRAHRKRKSHSTPSLLIGKLFDSNGTRFTPTHAVKNAKRYRYYTSQTVVRQAGMKPAITRFPAQELEQFVKSQIHLLLRAPDKCILGMDDCPAKDTARKKVEELAREWPNLGVSKQNEFVRKILRRVVVGEKTVWIEIESIKLLATLLGEDLAASSFSRTRKTELLKLSSDFQVLRRGSEIRVIVPHASSEYGCKPAPSLVNLVARARDWYEQIVANKIGSIDQLAQKTGLTRRYARRILQCATLSPRIVEALLTGHHLPNLTVNEILQPLPLDWREQEQRVLQIQ